MPDKQQGGQTNQAVSFGEYGLYKQLESENQVMLGTTGAVRLHNLTTVQRDALTAANGMVIYNTTDNKFQGYENGAWANLI
jgi:hypothetical protein